MIVITGAPCTIGRRVLRLLSTQGLHTRALSRDPSRGERLPNVEWAETDLAEPESLPPLFEGAERIRSRWEIRAASGEGRIPFIDTRDSADVAARVLTEDGHAGATYLVTGGVALDDHQVAGAGEMATGQGAEYVPESSEEARPRFAHEGLPERLIDSKLDLPSYQRADGETARTTCRVYVRPVTRKNARSTEGRPGACGGTVSKKDRFTPS